MSDGLVEELTTDVLVIGGGGAGTYAALRAGDCNPTLDITLVVKGFVAQSGCTRMVQGGYNAVLDPADSFELHFGDTLKGGGFINNQELAWVLVTEAPERIRELENRFGCFFDRHPDGRIHQKPFAGQSFDRTVHRGDLTGIEIMQRLKDQVFSRPNLRRLEEHRALDLLLSPDGQRVVGAVVLDMRRGTFAVVRARATVVATGGGATMYRIAAPSLEKAGDGAAMLYRAGVLMMDMEMMQFHPTGLLAGRSRLTGSVLEEGLRGAGGHLRNALGERYMERYDAQRMERSTRDVVARASYMEIQAGRGTANGGVWLDVSHLGAELVEQKFPGMVERCRGVGFDLAREPVEISPTAHFHMGGARIDAACRTSLAGLLVAGEDASGVHGANRLGGNGVAESIVFGARAGAAAATACAEAGQGACDPAFVRAVVQRTTALLGRDAGEDAYALREELGALTWDHFGLVRSADGLQKGLAQLADLRERAERISVHGGPRFNLEWQQALDVRNLVELARLVAEAAVARTESRGSHYRNDHPETDNARWLCNVLLRRHGDRPRLWTEPVLLTRMSPFAAAAGRG
ncbi:MAG: FAD-binding protein [Chloroflexi bacterium]|nr:FAD-binding protein [Chloroflexota bacterium]